MKGNQPSALDDNGPMQPRYTKQKKKKRNISKVTLSRLCETVLKHALTASDTTDELAEVRTSQCALHFKPARGNERASRIWT